MQNSFFFIEHWTYQYTVDVNPASVDIKKIPIFALPYPSKSLQNLCSSHYRLVWTSWFWWKEWGDHHLECLNPGTYSGYSPQDFLPSMGNSTVSKCMAGELQVSRKISSYPLGFVLPRLGYQMFYGYQVSYFLLSKNIAASHFQAELSCLDHLKGSNGEILWFFWPPWTPLAMLWSTQMAWL